MRSKPGKLYTQWTSQGDDSDDQMEASEAPFAEQLCARLGVEAAARRGGVLRAKPAGARGRKRRNSSEDETSDGCGPDRRVGVRWGHAAVEVKLQEAESQPVRGGTHTTEADDEPGQGWSRQVGVGTSACAK